MKFLVDAQLPYGMAQFLRDRGFDAIHTNDLPEKERTSDDQIREISQKENRIVITKDTDFIDSFLIKGIPKKLFIITTGNIRNKQLFSLFERNLFIVMQLFQTCNLIEMNNTTIIGH
ncbi:hypothetical protein FACS189446_3190 [Bacteroidia bacterium]|nr:hypothetical protein FACS189446_3190 [Bacteroidia bacterium]